MNKAHLKEDRTLVTHLRFCSGSLTEACNSSTQSAPELHPKELITQIITL